MSDFFDKIKTENVKSDLGYTDNGAVAYNTSGDSLVDFNFNISAYRQLSKESIADNFRRAFYEDKYLAMGYLFYLGDIREGLGERHVFKSLINDLAKKEPDLIRQVIDFIPEYGRWDEVLELLDTPLKKDAVNMITRQLKEDIENAKDNKSISLCAKWMPSINAANKSTRKNALILCDELGLSKKEYRKMLAVLRDKLNVIETVLAKNDMEKLANMQESLSSRQNLKYSQLLMRKIPEERKEYFDKVMNDEANFNISVLEPHEIYYKYRMADQSYFYESKPSENLAYEVMWNKLPNKVQTDKQVLVVRDGSASMCVPIPNTKAQVLDVASALTIYFSEHMTGDFKNKFITFSSHPDIVDMSKCKTLADKIHLLSTYNDCSNTNIEKTFNLILNTAINNNMKQEEMPENILIISDMQFDDLQHPYFGQPVRWDEPLFNSIRTKFENAGYKIPGLIFWNVNLSKSVIPEINNELGLVLIGGYSKNNIDMICNNDFVKEVVNEKDEVVKEVLTPKQALFNKINSERYKPVLDSIRGYLKEEYKDELFEKIDHQSLDDLINKNSTESDISTQNFNIEER